MNNIYLQKLLNKESKREEKIKVINTRRYFNCGPDGSNRYSLYVKPEVKE